MFSCSHQMCFWTFSGWFPVFLCEIYFFDGKSKWLSCFNNYPSKYFTVVYSWVLNYYYYYWLVSIDFEYVLILLWQFAGYWYFLIKQLLLTLTININYCYCCATYDICLFIICDPRQTNFVIWLTRLQGNYLK